MHILPRWAIVGSAVSTLAVICFVAGTVKSQPTESKDGTSKFAALTGQTYTGAKKCSACHFKEYMQWKKTGHAKEAWESVPAQYRTSEKCLPCHVTGYGHPTGFKDAASSANLVGTTCEACHGPGSKHEEVCKPFLNVKKLSPEQEKVARGSIYKPEIADVSEHKLPPMKLKDKAAQDIIAKIKPGEVCASCHKFKTPAEHPEYQK